MAEVDQAIDPDIDPFSILLGAIGRKDTVGLRELLESDPRYKLEAHRNPNLLRLAIQNWNTDAVRELIVNGGARVNTRDEYNETMLFAAETPAMVNLLFELDPETDIDALNDRDETFAESVASIGWVKLFRVLLDRGASIDVNKILAEAFTWGQIEMLHELVVNREIDPWPVKEVLKISHSKYKEKVLPYFQLLTLVSPRMVNRVGERAVIKNMPSELLRKLKLLLL